MTSRLERIRELAPPPPVWIVELDRGFSQFKWLCDEHINSAEKEGWVVKQKRAPYYSKPPLPCQSCQEERP